MSASRFPAAPISYSRGFLVVCLVAAGLGLAGAVVVAEPLDERVASEPATEFSVTEEGLTAKNGEEVVVVEEQAFEQIEFERTTATSFEVDVEGPAEPSLTASERERAVAIATQSDTVREALAEDPAAYNVTVEPTDPPAELSVEVGEDLNVSDDQPTFEVSFDESSATVTRTTESLYAAVEFGATDGDRSTTATVDLDDERVRSISQPLEPELEPVYPE